MMSKKDYVRAAEIVFKAAQDGRGEPLAAAFVEFFRGDNPRFDAARFRNACAGAYRIGIRAA